jgi:hypothetical protein
MSRVATARTGHSPDLARPLDSVRSRCASGDLSSEAGDVVGCRGLVNNGFGSKEPNPARRRDRGERRQVPSQGPGCTSGARKLGGRGLPATGRRPGTIEGSRDCRHAFGAIAHQRCNGACTKNNRCRPRCTKNNRCRPRRDLGRTLVAPSPDLGETLVPSRRERDEPKQNIGCEAGIDQKCRRLTLSAADALRMPRGRPADRSRTRRGCREGRFLSYAPLHRRCGPHDQLGLHLRDHHPATTRSSIFRAREAAGHELSPGRVLRRS